MSGVIELFPKAPAEDIPAMLRQLADDIESGETPADLVLAIVESREGVQPRLFGPATKATHVLGLLHMAAHHTCAVVSHVK